MKISQIFRLIACVCSMDSAVVRILELKESLLKCTGADSTDAASACEIIKLLRANAEYALVRIMTLWLTIIGLF